MKQRALDNDTLNSWMLSSAMVWGPSLGARRVLSVECYLVECSLCVTSCRVPPPAREKEMRAGVGSKIVRLASRTASVAKSPGAFRQCGLACRTASVAKPPSPFLRARPWASFVWPSVEAREGRGVDVSVAMGAVFIDPRDCARG